MTIGYFQQKLGPATLVANGGEILSFNVAAGSYLVYAKANLYRVPPDDEMDDSDFVLYLSLGASLDVAFGHLVSTRTFVDKNDRTLRTGGDQEAVALSIGGTVLDLSNAITLSGTGTPNNLVTISQIVVSAIKLDELNPAIRIPRLQRPPLQIKLPPHIPLSHKRYLAKAVGRLRKNAGKRPRR